MEPYYILRRNRIKRVPYLLGDVQISCVVLKPQIMFFCRYTIIFYNQLDLELRVIRGCNMKCYIFAYFSNFKLSYVVRHCLFPFQWLSHIQIRIPNYLNTNYLHRFSSLNVRQFRVRYFRILIYEIINKRVLIPPPRMISGVGAINCS